MNRTASKKYIKYEKIKQLGENYLLKENNKLPAAL